MLLGPIFDYFDPLVGEVPAEGSDELNHVAPVAQFKSVTNRLPGSVRNEHGLVLHPVAGRPRPGKVATWTNARTINRLQQGGYEPMHPGYRGRTSA